MSSSANEAPLEVLLEIFKQLPLYTLKEYQFVSKSWYQAARQLLLETVDLTGSNTVLFSEYLKRNPSYRNYIKTVVIRLGWESPKPGDSSAEEICATIQANCPEVQAVYNASSIGLTGYKLLYNLRNTLKEIEIGQNFKEGNVMDFLAHFPRLTKVNMRNYSQFSSIQQCLQLLENSPLVEELDCSLNPEYKLQIQPNSKLLNTLSNMKNFQVYMDGNMGSTTLNNFIKQYLSGLEYLSIEGWLDSDFRDHEKPLMVDLMDIACAVKEFAIDIKYLKYNVVQQYLTSVIQKVYYEIPETRTEKVHRMLAVGTTSEDEERQPPFSVIASCSEQEPGELTRSVELEYVLKRNNREDLEEVLSLCSEITDLDILHFLINDDGLPSRAFTIFRDLLDNFDCVKKVVLEVPEEVFGKRYMNSYESVTDLKILSSRMWEEYKKMKLLNVVDMFPGLKILNLSGYCGIKVDSNQYHVVLDKLDLDSLEIDVQFWANGWLQKKHNDILLSVDINKKNIKRFYKVLYNGLQVNEIQENEYGQSNDTKVYIKAKNLNELTLYRRQVFSIEDIKTTLSFL